MKKKLLIFPFNRESEPLFFCNKHLRDYEVGALVSFSGSGLVGRIYRTGEVAYKVTDEFSKSIEICDALFVSAVWHETDFLLTILPKIEEAVKLGKEVICTQSLFISQKENLVHYSHAGCLKILPEASLNAEAVMTSQITTPVLYVVGVAQNTGKFETEILLKSKFEEEGYKVALLASRPEASLFGSSAFPSYMLDGSIHESDRIYSFSSMVKQIEIHERPDLIIVGIPGTVVPYSYRYAEDYGILGMLINYAVPPDAAVLCTLCPVEDDTRTYFTGTDELFKQRFGVDISYHFVSGYTFDFASVETQKKYEYLSLTDKYVCTQLDKLDSNRCSAVGDEAGAKLAVEKVISSLSKN